MKPRNAYEREVVAINNTLKEDIAERDLNWAIKKFDNKDWGKEYRYYYPFSLTMQRKGIKITRAYRLYKKKVLGARFMYFVVEVIREYADVNSGRKAYCYKTRNGLAGWDGFSFQSDIELHESPKCDCYWEIDIMLQDSIETNRRQAYGKRVACVDINPSELARVIRQSPVAETMYKDGSRVFGWLLWGTHIKEKCRAYVIAKRHGFDVESNLALWLDMVNAIVVCGKDYRNPVFVAPKDLMATHDRFVTMYHNYQQRKQREQQERERLRRYEAIQQEIERNKQYEEAYIKARKRFFDMLLQDKDMEIRALRSIEEFKEEGMAMHHCVYSCRYWDLSGTHKYSLILSVRIGGERAETVEVNLHNYTIAQAYGKYDKFTEHHDRIVNFIKANMGVIKQYNRTRAVRKAA